MPLMAVEHVDPYDLGVASECMQGHNSAISACVHRKALRGRQGCTQDLGLALGRLKFSLCYGRRG